MSEGHTPPRRTKRWQIAISVQPRAQRSGELAKEAAAGLNLKSSESEKTA